MWWRISLKYLPRTKMEELKHSKYNREAQSTLQIGRYFGEELFSMGSSSGYLSVLYGGNIIMCPQMYMDRIKLKDDNFLRETLVRPSSSSLSSPAPQRRNTSSTFTQRSTNHNIINNKKLLSAHEEFANQTRIAMRDDGRKSNHLLNFFD